MTVKELETWIVRMGEKYPDRVGPSVSRTIISGERCLLGQVCFELGADFDDFTDVTNYIGSSAKTLAYSAAGLNDKRVPWGQIPKRLGLIPGEQPAELPVAEPAEVA